MAEAPPAPTSYTEAQREAISCLDEPLQIIACAGSGKTQVISQRIASILAQPGVEPRNVVAFTFTEKAAAELKERIHGILEGGGFGTQGLAEMYIGTMHGYALNLLQTLVPETFKFSVLSDITCRLLVDRNSTRSGLTTCPTLSSGTPHLKRYIHSKLYLQAMSVLREDDLDWSKIPDGVQASADAYVALLYEHRDFDFTEIINLAVQYLEEEDPDDASAVLVRGHVKDVVRYVVVDEYQDVNPLQERLVQGLTQFGANVCVVGDDDQTIYQFRGSQVHNIITFEERYAGVRQVTLADNFRSSRGVVEVGRSIAERIVESHRLPKAMLASGHQTYERGDLLALEFSDEEEEAAWICDRIQAMRGLSFRDAAGSAPRGLAWSDFAVLFRSVAGDAGPLVDELRRRDIPYVVKGLNRLFDSPEIKAVVGIFKYMNSETTAAALKKQWEDADLVPASANWATAMAVLDEGRDFGRGKRWGIYNIQRLYLDFLDALEWREENLPGDPVRRELTLYQLGKFSQVISDFEQIYFNSAPDRKYEGFSKWLEYQAGDYYAESDADVGYAQPDAVVISTIHQAKGMQWPAVFVPCLRRNRFPSKRQGGLGLFHVIPDTAVGDPDRYRGEVEDETRLFYVAVTRAQKYLFTTFSPTFGNQLYRKRSPFFDHCTEQQWFLTKDPGVKGEHVEPQAKRETPNVTITFSELKYLFECPYQFKLRFLYGFNPPIHEALGFGKGLHDALSEVHKRALQGEIVSPDEAPDLVQRHLFTPFAYPDLREQLEGAAVESVGRYLKAHQGDLDRTIHSEKQIQVHVAPGITVDGRIDLIRRLDTEELSVVDFKSSDRAQAEEVTSDQLHVYAVGYEELTGERPDIVEVLNLDKDGRSRREQVDDPLLVQVRSQIREAGDAVRNNALPRLREWTKVCSQCDLAALCRDIPPAERRERHRHAQSLG